LMPAMSRNRNLQHGWRLSGMPQSQMQRGLQQCTWMCSRWMWMRRGMSSRGDEQQEGDEEGDE